MPNELFLLTLYVLAMLGTLALSEMLIVLFLFVLFLKKH